MVSTTVEGLCNPSSKNSVIDFCLKLIEILHVFLKLINFVSWIRLSTNCSTTLFGIPFGDFAFRTRMKQRNLTLFVKD